MDPRRARRRPRRHRRAHPTPFHSGGHRRARRPAAAVVALGLAATACGGIGAGGPPEELAGDWLLTAGEHDGAEIPIVEGHDITLTVEGEDWGGTAACNHYGATVAVDDDRVRVSGLFQTEMACGNGQVMDSEAAYLDAFGRVERFEATGDRLRLTGPSVELRYAAVPPEPDAALEGTRWEVTSLIEGAGPDGAVSSASDDAHLRLREDGRLEADTGCRELTGTWARADDGLRLDDLASDDADCPEGLDRQDAHVRAVLDGEVTVELEGRSLRLLGADGRGLDLRAGE